MKYLLTALFMIGLFVQSYSQILIIRKTDGCNNFGGHESDPIVDTVQVWANSLGLTVSDVEADNETWENLPVANYCMTIFINTSGDEVVVTPAEEAWLMTFRNNGGVYYCIHASAGDTERTTAAAICNITNSYLNYEALISGVSLTNGGCNAKHECNGNLERVLIVDKTHPITVALQDSVFISDEFYYTLDGSFLPTNQILVEIDEDGQSPGNIPIMWLTNSHSLSLTLGHSNSGLPPVADGTEWAYTAFKSGFDYMISLTTCGSPVFALPDELEPAIIDAEDTDDGGLITFIDNILTYQQVDKQPYTIFDMGGRVLYKGMAEQIDFSNSPAGRYYLKSYNTHFVINKR